jgi:hypothetical protein
MAGYAETYPFIVKPRFKISFIFDGLKSFRLKPFYGFIFVKFLAKINVSIRIIDL